MARTPTSKPTPVRAVERAVEILQCFSPENPTMSVLDIQRRVPLSRPTLYRLLHTLARKGLVRAYGDPQRFSLDFGVGRLAHNWMSGIDPIRIGRPIVERLRDETNETAALFLLRGHLRLCVLESTTPHVLAIARGVGETEHICRGASGKSILASMDDDAIAPILRSLPHGIEKKRLFDDLEQIRRDGFAVSRGEVFVGAIAIAAPYFDHTQRVAGSIGAFGPQARLDDKWVTRTTRLVVAGAAELSAALGHMSPIAADAAGAERRRRQPAASSRR
jgi:IclR family acetate operon transcriptional repressor